MAKKKAKMAKLFFVLPNGNRYEVTGEDGKYIFCGETQFRKSANRGKLVTEEIAPEPEKAPEDDAEAQE